MREMLMLLFLASFVCTTSALSPESTCYYPDGKIATGDYPCFLGQSDSPCCGAGSICEASGLCRVPGSTGVSDLLRGSCTDSTWTSSSCSDYCTDANTGGTNLISCQNVTKSTLDFCCDHTSGCCDSGIGRFQVGLNTDVLTLGSSGATVSTSLTSASSTTTPSPSSSSYLTSSGSLSTATSSAINTKASETSSSTSTTNPSESSDLSIGAKAGIGIACAIGGLAIGGGAVYFCMRRRRHSHTTSEMPQAYLPGAYVPEIDGVSRMPEMEAQPAKRIGGNEQVELAA